jgi:butyryl-CoA dehydrogenase
MTDKAKKHKGHQRVPRPDRRRRFTRGKPDEKVGIAPPARAVFFEGCAIRRATGSARRDGFKIAMSTLDGGRIGIASQALGIARARSTERARTRSARRSGSRSRLPGHPVHARRHGDRDRCGAAPRLARGVDEGQGVRHSAESAMAKLYASEMSERVTSKAIQIHGGYGYVKEYDVERHWRDSRITEIYEGTSEIQRLVISSSVLKD